MPLRKPLATGEVYHVLNKSIAGYKIFNGKRDYTRMIQMLRYFSCAENLPKFSQYLERTDVQTIGFEKCFEQMFGGSKQHVQITAYCLMPTHFHLVTKQLRKGGITTFMFKMLNSYTRYFNTKYKRKGPLWVSRFKSILVDSDEQLLHLTRYVHLNPTTAGLAKKPQDWTYGSYTEYINPKATTYPLCQFEGLINMKSQQYRTFVNDYVDYQRELGKIKKLILE